MTLGDESQAFNKAFASKKGEQSVFKTPGDRLPVSFDFSQKPMRRLGQEMKWKGMASMQTQILKHADEIPSMFIGTAKTAAKRATPQARFEKLNRVDMSHRAAAKQLWVEMVLHAGKALDDPETRPMVLRGLLMHQYMNFMRHAPRVAEDNRVLRKAKKTGEVLGLKNQHLTFVKDSRLIGGNYQLQIDFRKSTRKAVQLNKDRSRYAEMANSVKPIHQELRNTQDNVLKLAEKAKADHPDAIIKTTKAGYIKMYARDENGLLTRAPFAELNTAQELLKTLKNRASIADRHARKHQAITAELDKTLGALRGTETATGLEIMKDQRKNVFAWPEAEFEKHVQDLGQWATTTNPLEAARSAEGHYLVVPKHDVANLQRELGGSIDVIRKFWRGPSTFWKRAQIGYTPRTITQNMVGNYLIDALRDPSLNGFLGLMRSVDKLKGGTEAARMAAVGRRHHPDGWIFREFGDELANGLGQEIKSKNANSSKLRRAASSGFYPIVSKTSEAPIRLGAIFSHLQKHPVVKQIMKEKGVSFDRAARIALRRVPGLRDEAARHARTIAGDYITKGPIETIISDFVPFYLWDKHIVKSMGNTLADNPERLAVMQRFGQEGYATTEKLLGDLPEFLKSVVPGDMLPFLKDKHNGRADVFLTNYLNPFAQIGDLANVAEGGLMGKGPRPGDAIASQLNPFLSSGIEFISGKSLLTGADINRGIGGLPGYVGRDVGQGLPFTRLAKALTQDTQSYGATGKPFLYTKDKWGVLSSLLGLPVRDMSLDKAGQLAQNEHTEIAKQFGEGPPRKGKSPFSLVPPM
jgi:hypothetical protein